MKRFLKRFEDYMVAITFAEADEAETARRVLSDPDWRSPKKRVSKKVTPDRPRPSVRA